ncbi:MAG: hypothetical protein WCQ21_25810 [Verrucomicrobiota bacterium]
MQKTVYWLATARKEGEKPAKVLDQAVTLAGYKNSDATKMTTEALLRNLDIAEKLGCLDDAGLADMKRGKAATVMKGPYKGGGAGTGQRDCELGIDADADERQQERQDRRPPTRNGQEVLSGGAVEQKGT